MACTYNHQHQKKITKTRGHYQIPYGSDYKNTIYTIQGIQEGDPTKNAPTQEPKIGLPMKCTLQKSNGGKYT